MRCLLQFVLVVGLSLTVLSLGVPEIAANDLPGRIAHLQHSLAAVEHERALAEQSGDAQSLAVLDEVHRNIAFTVADIRDDDQLPGDAPRSRNEALPPPSDKRRGRAMHLNSAARHLEAAGYESLAAKVRVELKKHERRDRPTGGESTEVQAKAGKRKKEAEAKRRDLKKRRRNLEKKRPMAERELSERRAADRPPPAMQRMGRAIEDLSTAMKRLQRDMDALKRQVRQMQKQYTAQQERAKKKRDKQRRADKKQ